MKRSPYDRTSNDLSRLKKKSEKNHTKNKVEDPDVSNWVVPEAEIETRLKFLQSQQCDNLPALLQQNFCSTQTSSGITALDNLLFHSADQWNMSSSQGSVVTDNIGGFPPNKIIEFIGKPEAGISFALRQVVKSFLFQTQFLSCELPKDRKRGRFTSPENNEEAQVCLTPTEINKILDWKVFICVTDSKDSNNVKMDDRTQESIQSSKLKAWAKWCSEVIASGCGKDQNEHLLKHVEFVCIREPNDLLEFLSQFNIRNFKKQPETAVFTKVEYRYLLIIDSLIDIFLHPNLIINKTAFNAYNALGRKSVNVSPNGSSLSPLNFFCAELNRLLRNIIYAANPYNGNERVHHHSNIKIFVSNSILQSFPLPTTGANTTVVGLGGPSWYAAVDLRLLFEIRDPLWSAVPPAAHSSSKVASNRLSTQSVISRRSKGSYLTNCADTNENLTEMPSSRRNTTVKQKVTLLKGGLLVLATEI